MGFVRRGGGGGGGDDGGGGDELLGDVHKRCTICRRELLPWEDVCPEDGGAAVMPGDLGAGHDALLAQLLAGDPDGEDDDENDGENDDPPEPASNEFAPGWPANDDLA
jgi:hypothetical protein